MGNLISQPRTGLNILAADPAPANTPQRILVVGELLSGTGVAGSLYTDLGIGNTEDTLFSSRAPVSEMIRTVRRTFSGAQIDAIGLTANGTAATYTITVTGTATEAGTITVNHGGKKNHTSIVTVSSGDSNSDIATAIAADINADSDSLVVAVAASNVVTCTVIVAGAIGNGLPIGVELNGGDSGLLAGVTIAVAAGVVGSGVPTAAGTSAVFDPVQGIRYQAIIWPYDNVVASQFMDTRFNVLNKVIDGVVFSHRVDTYANVLADLSPRNSESEVIVCDQQVAIGQYIGPANQEHGIVQAAAFVALRAKRLTEGEVLTQNLTTTASSDQFGGPALASLPYANSTIPELSITLEGYGFEDDEIEAINVLGGTVFGTNSAGNGQLIGEVFTTYKNNPAGVADGSWEFLNYVDTMSQIREYFFNNYKARFAQSRLTEGAVEFGRDMVNKLVFDAYTDRLFSELGGEDYVLCQSGEDAINFFKRNRTSSLDLQSGTITVFMITPIVTQARNLTGSIKLAFSTQES